jgi:hypothetical protein
MRRLFLLLLIIVAMPYAVTGQIRYGDGPSPKFFVEADFRVGGFSENITTNSLTSAYSGALNPYAGNINFTGTKSFSYHLQLGYYFNRKRNLGIGTGIFFMRQTGNLEMDSFHVEYMATDYQNDVYRQLISSNGQLNETVKVSNITIPLILRYRKDIIQDLFLTVDAGILYNIMLQNKYSATAGFDYEAIYKIQGTGTNLSYVYDNAATPGGTDWLITKAEFQKDNPNGDMQAYFNSLKSLGYNVGLGDTARKSGKIKYTNTSVGFTFQSAINYKLRDKIYGKAGLFVMEESFSNSANNSFMPLTSKPFEYNSILNYTKSVQTWSYGLLFGLSFYL